MSPVRHAKHVLIPVLLAKLMELKSPVSLVHRATFSTGHLVSFCAGGDFMETFSTILVNALHAHQLVLNAILTVRFVCPALQATCSSNLLVRISLFAPLPII
jgi:hypothetical protein